MNASDSRPGLLFLSDHLGHGDGSIHGATRYFLNVLPRISREKYRLHVCFLRGEHPAAAVLRDSGVFPVFLGKSKWDVTAARDILNLIRDQRIHLLHAAAMKGMLFGRMAARRARIPAIIHFHDMLPVRQPILAAQRALASRTARGIAISAAVAEFARESFRLPEDKIRILPNGVDLSSLTPPPPERLLALRQKFGIPETNRILLSVGRLDEVKNPMDTLKIFAAVRGRHPDSSLLFVGDGILKERLIEEANSLGLADCVHFAGHRNDIADIYALAHLLLATPRSEGFGLAVVEAMAMGVPVVAYAVGGLREVASGVLVPAGDVEKAAEETRSLLEDSALYSRLSSEARESARRYDVSLHVQRLEALYDEVLAENP